MSKNNKVYIERIDDISFRLTIIPYWVKQIEKLNQTTIEQYIAWSCYYGLRRQIKKDRQKLRSEAYSQATPNKKPTLIDRNALKLRKMKAIAQSIIEHDELSTAQLCKMHLLAHRTCARYLAQMVENKQIEMVGKNKYAKYKLTLEALERILLYTPKQK